MNWLTQYMTARYEDGARGPHTYDCWGLCREVRHTQYGKALLPSWGHVRNDMPKEFTRAYREESAKMEQCPAEPGAVAAVFIGALVTHVGVVIEVDSRLAVLEITPNSSARWTFVPDYEAKHAKVVYYRDKCLPVET